MIRTHALRLFLICAAGLSYLISSSRAATPSPAAAPSPPYAILLRSRGAVVRPEKSKYAQTGGGYIQVTQIQPNVVMFLMRGAVAARAAHKDGGAAMQFELNQDFEIVPLRAVAHPPRISLAAWVIGALDSTDLEGGTAEQAAGCATVQAAAGPLLKVNVNPHTVSGGQNLLVNDRSGPLEACLVPGGYTLHQTFALNANQPKRACRPGFASADFDPEPKLDTSWSTLLKPFRAVPHKDFGFRVLLRVVEDVPPAVEPTLPPPTPEKTEPPVEEEAAKP